MEKKVLISQDRDKIEEIVFKYPEIMRDNAEKLIKEEYYNLLDLEEELYKARRKVIELEKAYEAKRELFNGKSNLFDLKFRTSEKEIITQESNVLFKGVGNDLLGYSNS